MDVTDEVVRSSTGHATGVGGARETCGAVPGGVQAIGLRYGRVDRAVRREPAIERAGDLVSAFRERFGSASCRELVERFPDMAHPARKEHCARLVGFVAGWLANTLDGSRQP